MCMDRYEITNEISELLNNSPEPHADWKYIAKSMIQMKRVHLGQEDTLLEMMGGLLKI